MNDEELFAALDLDAPGLDGVRQAVAGGDLAAAKRALAAHIRGRSSPRWFFRWQDRPAPTKTARDFPEAETLLRHEFTFGFHGARAYTATFGEQINWGANPTVGEDKTHLWNESLNRHFHFRVLTDAYWETGDERFAQGLVRDWLDWIAHNPRPLDSSGNNVEWPYGCYAWQTLTTGIRLEASWPNALYRALGSPAFTDDAIAAILGSICDQARHLVKWPTAHNWLTEESMGLYTAGMLFPEFREAAEWRRIAIERLYWQLTDEVYPDGAEYELAAGYGNWVVHNFVNLLQRARMNGRDAELPADLVARMEKMFDHVLAEAMPDGTMPGLNDSGNADVRRLLQSGYELFPQRDDFRYVASDRAEGEPPALTSCARPYAGHYIMRSGWDADARYLLFDSGPYGSAHQHEDKLHVVLYAYGKQLLLDPGNYSYDASRWRRYVLTTPGHNTIMVDGQGQHRRGLKETYYWPRPWETPAPPDNDTLWATSPAFDVARGTYRDDYGEENDRTVTHTRWVLFLKPEYWVIIDALVATDDRPHTYESLFHLDADTARVDAPARVVATINADAANLTIVPLLPHDGPMADRSLGVRIAAGEDEPVQGWANDPWRPVPTAIYKTSGAGTVWLAYALYPTRAGEVCPVVGVAPAHAAEKGSDSLALAVHFADGRADHICVSTRPGQEARWDAFSTDAEIAVARLRPDGAVARAFAVGGTLSHRGAPLPLD